MRLVKSTRMTAMEHDALRPLLAVQRWSSLNASGLIVEGRSTTLSGQPVSGKPDMQHQHLAWCSSDTGSKC